MFNRLQQTYRILTYKPPSDGPDVIIVPEAEVHPSTSSRRIAKVLEWFMLFAFFCVIGLITGRIGKVLEPVWGKKLSASIVVAGAMGAFLLWLSHQVVDDMQGRLGRYIRGTLKVSERLAPYFGHRLDDTIRTLRG